MKFLKIISIILITLNLSRCSSNTTDSKVQNCKLTDTLIKKITYGINKQTFSNHISLKENKYIDLGENKLWLRFTPSFYKDQLFSLSVDLDTEADTSNTTIVYKSLEDFTKNFKQQKKKSFTDNYLACSLYQKVFDLYLNKYGAPDQTEEIGKKGSWQTEEMNSYYIEYMDFDIHKKYEWTCSMKYIKIEFDIHAKLNSELAKSNKSDHEILTSKSYQEINYSSFNIIYEDVKLKTLYQQAIGKKAMENLRIEDSIRKQNDKKIKENI